MSILRADRIEMPWVRYAACDSSSSSPALRRGMAVESADDWIVAGGSRIAQLREFAEKRVGQHCRYVVGVGILGAKKCNPRLESW